MAGLRSEVSSPKREYNHGGDHACLLGDDVAWWRCGNPEGDFVGCCSMDPCDGIECPDPPQWQPLDLGSEDSPSPIKFTGEPTTARLEQRRETDSESDSDFITSTITVRATTMVGPPVSAEYTWTVDDPITITIDTRTSTLINTHATTRASTTTRPSKSSTTEETSTSQDIITEETSIPESSNIYTTSVSALLTAGTTELTESLPAPSAATFSTISSPYMETSEHGAMLQTSTVVGIAVGSSAAGLIVVIFLLLFFRRRSKRLSSVRAASPPKYDDDKFVGTGTSFSHPTALSDSTSGANEAGDVFAPFGGESLSPPP